MEPKPKPGDRKPVEKKPPAKKKQLVLLMISTNDLNVEYFEKFTDNERIEQRLLEMLADDMGVGRDSVTGKVKELLSEIWKDGMPRFLGKSVEEDGAVCPRPTALLMAVDPIFIEYRVEKTVGFTPKIPTPDA